MVGRRLALIIANDTYEHAGLSRLRAPAADAQALAGVLGDPQVGGFDVQIVHNEPAHAITGHIEELFAERRPDDVVLLHFSGHGLKSESGELFLAAANTRPNRLGSTAVSADFVQRSMRACRSRSVVLLLDCCYGGAFGRGVTVRATGDANVLDSFAGMPAGGGRGRAVITASSAMEYAFEEDRLTDDQTQPPSIFTAAVVEGLASGAADRDEDGWVSLNELYDYVFDRVRERNPHQTPSRDVEMQGELYLARSGRRKVVASPLPPDLGAAVHDTNMFARLGAVTELGSRLASRDLPAALGAYEALVAVERDDIRVVAEAARSTLSAAGVQPPERALHFGEVDVDRQSHLRVRLGALPLSRAWTVSSAPSWVAVAPVAEGFDLSVAPSDPGDHSGHLVLKGPTGDLVIPVDAVVLPRSVSEPMVVGPGLAEPEVVEPEVVEPVIAEPVIAEPEVAKPVVPVSEVAGPEVAETEEAEPLVSGPEVREPVGSEPAPASNLVEPDLVEPARARRWGMRRSVSERRTTPLRPPTVGDPERSTVQPSVAGAAIVMGGLSVFLAAPTVWVYDEPSEVGVAVVEVHLAAYGAFRLWQAWTWRRQNRPAALGQALVGAMALVATAIVLAGNANNLVALIRVVGWFWLASGVAGAVAAYLLPAGRGRILEACTAVPAAASGVVALQLLSSYHLYEAAVFLVAWTIVLGALLVAIGVVDQMSSGAYEPVRSGIPLSAGVAAGVVMVAALAVAYSGEVSFNVAYVCYGAALLVYGVVRLRQAYTERGGRRAPWLALLGVMFPVAGGLYIAWGTLNHQLPALYLFVALAVLGGAVQVVAARLGDPGRSRTTDGVTGISGVIAGIAASEFYAAENMDPNGYTAGLWVLALAVALVVAGVERLVSWRR